MKKKNREEPAIHDAWGSSVDSFTTGNCVGIDLGTTNCCVAIWKDMESRVKVLKNSFGKKTTPSVIHFSSNENHIVGKPALDEILTSPSNTVVCVKRLLGKRYDETSVQKDKEYFSFPIAKSSDGMAVVKMDGKCITPEVLSSMILCNIKETAESYFKEKVENAVITVPAYFNDAQRRATLQAADLAGFRSVRLLNEPTAAAMSYGLFVAGKKQIIVVDLGGGTFDVSLLKIDDGKLQVIGIGGDTHLGGEDINALLFDYILGVLKRKHKIGAALSKLDRTRLQIAIEKAKIELSSHQTTTIKVEKLCEKLDFQYELSRNQLNDICSSVFTRCLEVTKQVLIEANVCADQVNEVVLVGGSTRIPQLRSMLRTLFNEKELCLSINPDIAVAQGAAIQSALLAGIDHGVLKDILMIDVLPISMGLEKADGSFEILLPRNSSIPLSATKYFETFEDDQQGITVEVYEGEEKIAKSNKHICYFNFTLPKSKRGKAGEFKHPVTFTMNANGVLQVQAGIHHDHEPDMLSNFSYLLLILYVVFLFGCYVFLKIYFSNDREEIFPNT